MRAHRGLLIRLTPLAYDRGQGWAFCQNLTRFPYCLTRVSGLRARADASEVALAAVEWKDLPPHVQEAITRREAFTSPISTAIESLGFTWEIAGGNLAEIDRALKVWEGDGWRAIHNDAATKHRYHRDLLRLFHNFLSSAVAAVWHAERIVGGLKTVAPELSQGFKSRIAVVAASDAFLLLRQLRDYAIHTAHHPTVLKLQDASSPTGPVLVSKVCFEVEALRGHVEGEMTRARTTRKRDEFQRVLGLLDTLKTPEMWHIVESYHTDVGGLLGGYGRS